MRVLKDVSELDATIVECDQAKTDDELRSILSSFCMEQKISIEIDPFSEKYYEIQMSLYRSISGRTYSLSNESTPFDLERAVTAPFPYSTQSCQTTGDHFVAIGEFLRHLHLPAGANVLEFGPGWGNLTLVLAQMGYQVTCVDIEPKFCELIRRRAKILDLDIDVINDDFSWASRSTKTYDAIIFFECFHHAADHITLLKNLHFLLKPGGRVYLGAEPILESFPVPWGVRLDGQSLWSVRKFGWMELGFQDDYFRNALKVTDWDGFRNTVHNPAIWELASAKLPKIYKGNNSKFGTLTGRVAGEHLVFDCATDGVALFGPYTALPAGNYIARIRFVNNYSMIGQAIFDVCASKASEIFISCLISSIESEDLIYIIELPFSLSFSRHDIEVRILNKDGFSGRIKSIEIDNFCFDIEI